MFFSGCDALLGGFTLCFMYLYIAGEGPEFIGEPLIREESSEMDVSEDGCPDDGGDQRLTEEEKEKSTSTDQQTQESEVSLIRGLLLTV